LEIEFDITLKESIPNRNIGTPSIGGRKDGGSYLFKLKCGGGNDILRF